MSDYVKATNFASKDSLPSGNSLKIVKGTELNTEFDGIATAVATKADLNSPTFLGVPAAPTAAVGTNTTQLATTGLVFAVMQALYPVGSIYSSTVSTTPATLFGFGTWVAYAAGRVMIGNGGGFSAGATGGSANAIVVSHTHTITDAGHSHTKEYTNQAGAGSGTFYNGASSGINASTNSATTGITIDSAGSSGTNANLQPYVVIYAWNRTA
jgi:hypothetical protein